MDRTTLFIVLDDNKTYDKKGAEEIWIASDQSGLEKSHCDIELTVFADGKTLSPLIIFWGLGLRINIVEKKKNFIDALRLFFSLKHGWRKYCDWGNHFVNPATPGSTGKILFAYIHRAQQTSRAKQLLHKNKKILINIPGGATSRIQPLDVVMNKLFKIMFEIYSKNILMKTLKLVLKEHYLLQKEEFSQLSQLLRLGKKLKSNRTL